MDSIYMTQGLTLNTNTYNYYTKCAFPMTCVYISLNFSLLLFQYVAKAAIVSSIKNNA